MIARVRPARLYALAIVMTLTAVAFPVGAWATGSSTAQKCSTSGLHPSVNRLSARGTSCANARKLETEWRRRSHPSSSPCEWADGSTKPGVCTVAGWRCVSTHTVNGQTYPVVCGRRRARRQVKFILPV
jgi:hypothetical protein